MSVLKVNLNNFETVKNSEKTVLLDFYADWCGPCRMVSPIVDEIAEENPQYLVARSTWMKKQNSRQISGWAASLR